MPFLRGAHGRAWRGLWAATLVLITIAVVGVVWGMARPRPVREHLLRAGTAMEALQRHVAIGDLTAARITLTELQQHTAAATRSTRAWDWRAASIAPVLGDDLAAVRTVAEVLDDLSHQTLPRLLDLAETMDLSTVLPAGGSTDVSALRQAAPAVADLDDQVRHARERVAAIGSDDLLPQVRQGVDDLGRGLDELSALTTTARRASALLPPMLGLDGPRTYLVLLQNLAEVRATGGMPGAFIVVRADRGRFTLVDQGSASAALRVFPEPVLPLEPSQLALYTERLGIYPADVNFTPHFPTAAVFAREMYRQRSGVTVDGVVATDPVALAYLLKATGPVQVAGGPELTTENAVRVLLSDVYATMDGLEQDAYFAAAARATFEALTHRVANPGPALAALELAAAERRLLVWSAHPEEQQQIEGTVLEGALPTRDGSSPTVGVFLNDGSGAKLGYYLTHSARADVAGCRPDGRLELTLRLTMGSTAPAHGLPKDVLGMGLSGDPYTVRTNVLVFSPAGGSVLDMRLDGVPTSFGAGTERRRHVSVLTVDLRPNQERTIEARLLSDALPGDTDRVSPRLWVTPGVNAWQLRVDSSRACPHPDYRP